MRRSTWLRIAAVVTVLCALGHTSGYPWTPAVGAAEQPILDGMRHVSFPIFGSVRTYWDFYQGFALGITVLLLVLSVLMWQLASAAKAASTHVRPATLTLFIGFLFYGVTIAKYFFILPMVLVAIIVICLGVALVARPDA